MPAPKGNKYWKFRDKHGRDFKYTPDELWEEAKLYFEWIETNPLKEEKGFAFQGVITKESFNKMRAMTKVGFCLFADISMDTFDNYAKNDDFIGVITRISNIIYSQKFEGAAAELLNPNIIARDLGLRDESKRVIEFDEDPKINITIDGKNFGVKI
jgi:hypothetical protein